MRLGVRWSGCRDATAGSYLTGVAHPLCTPRLAHPSCTPLFLPECSGPSIRSLSPAFLSCSPHLPHTDFISTCSPHPPHLHPHPTTLTPSPSSQLVDVCEVEGVASRLGGDVRGDLRHTQGVRGVRGGCERVCVRISVRGSKVISQVRVRVRVSKVCVCVCVCVCQPDFQ